MVRRLVGIVVTSLMCALPLVAATVTGTVNDGVAGHPPIEGVDVTAFDAAGNRLGVTVLTDTSGVYKLENIPTNTIITIKYDKINYIDKPTTRPNISVTSDNTPVSPTYLAQRNGTDVYYAQFARALAESPDSADLMRLLEHLGSEEQKKVEGYRVQIRQEQENLQMQNTTTGSTGQT